MKNIITRLFILGAVIALLPAGAAACSLGTAGEPRQLNGILDRENYALRGVGEYVAAFDAAGGFIVDLGDLTEPGEARPPAWGMIVSRYDPKWSVREDRLPDFAALVTTYGMEMFDDDGNPVLPAERQRKDHHVRGRCLRRQIRASGHSAGPDRAPFLRQQPCKLCLPPISADHAKGLVHPAFPLKPWYARRGRR